MFLLVNDDYEAINLMSACAIYIHEDRLGFSIFAMIPAKPTPIALSNHKDKESALKALKDLVNKLNGKKAKETSTRIKSVDAVEVEEI